MRTALLVLLLLLFLGGCGAARHEVTSPPPLRVERCRGRTGLILTPEIAATWQPANPWEGQWAQGTMAILWCGEGRLHLEEMVGSWGSGESGQTVFSTALDVVLEPNQEHLAPLRGITTAEGAVIVLGHVGETRDGLVRATAYVLVGPAVPPSEAARRCAEEGGHLESGGLLGDDTCVGGAR